MHEVSGRIRQGISYKNRPPTQWYGEEGHQKGLKQLSNYLEIKSHKNGYLVIFNFNKNKDCTAKKYDLDGKEIFEIVV